jgi:4-hydroxy-2-oxoheptanedioate aldolase
VRRVFEAAHAAGKTAGVNAFDPTAADDYLAAGADFLSASADVTILARGSEAQAARFIPASGSAGADSY